MSTNTTPQALTDAEQYNADIVESLQLATIVADYIEQYHAGTLDDDDAVTAILDEHGVPHWIDATRAAFVRALAEVGDLDDATPSDAFRPYFADALAIEATGKHDGTEWTVTGVEVTITSGGPSTWIEWNGNRHGLVTVRTVWSSDRAAETVEACALADLCAEWADSIEQQ